MRKGHADLEKNKKLLVELIDRFNVMLASVCSLPEFSHVKYLDLRGTLKRDSATYKKDWANELHPSEKGFDLVTKKFADAIEKL